MNAVAPMEPAPLPAAVSETAAIIHMIERAATNPDVDIDKMERLLAMQERVLTRNAATAYDPFAGDDYGNDFIDFGAKIVNGRKVYQCHICQGPIAKGERHRVDSCILDGERLHARFCGICCAAMAISSEDGGEAITAREPEFQPPLLEDPS